MKKLYVLCAAALLAASSAQAEKGTIFLYGPESFQAIAVSPNGKWACGTVGDGTTIMRGLLWNLATGEYTYLSGSDESLAYDVNDLGMVAGSFTDYSQTDNGAPVAVPGIYQNGEWTALDVTSVEGMAVSGGTAMSISNDGKVVVGANYVNGKYRPVKWVDGMVDAVLPSEEGCAYTVSEDGTMVGGWSMETLVNDKGATVNNRAAVYWDENNEKHITDNNVSYLHAVQKISPDKTKMLCTAFGHSFIYEVASGEKTLLPYYDEQNAYNQSFYYISNEGLVMGGETTQDMMTGATNFYGYIYENGEVYDMTDWLAAKNVIIDESQISIANGMDMDADHNTIVAMAYKYNNGIMTGAFTSVAILMDREITYAEPVALKAVKLKGVNRVSLTWNEPIINAGNALGYNVYRNDVKITADPIGEREYADAVEDGEYTYAVTAVYEGETGELVESEKSEPVTVQVAPDALSTVGDLMARTMGYNDLLLRWKEPASNLPAATYFDNTATISAFGGGNVSFEIAIRIDEYARNYAEDYKIAQVSFMPWAQQAHFEIRIYENDEVVYTQPVSDEGLVYTEMNAINLTTPYTLNPNAKTYVAIAVDASQLSANEVAVVGINYGPCTDGYSDLLRQAIEPEFYSLNESAIAQGITGGMPVSWALSAILAPVDESGTPDLSLDVIEGYDVYRNDALLTSLNADATQYIDAKLATGTYNYGVAVRYADGKVSDKETLTVEMEPNVNALTKVTNVTVNSEASFVDAKWSAPLNNDETFLTYSNDVPGDPVSASSGTDLVELTVAADFTYDFIEFYEGYTINGIRFYPIGEAIFTVVLEVNGEDVDVVSVGEMGAADGYSLNQWNTVALNEPVQIEKGYTYRVKIICSEVDPTLMPISLDSGVGYAGVSDLYSSDYTNFQSITYNSLSGNWMLGMVVNNGSTEPLDVEGYNVTLDGEQVNTELVTDTTYHQAVNYQEGSTHRIRIDVVYPDHGTVNGDNVYFEVAPAAVESIAIDRVKVYPNPATSYIRIEGAVDSADLYDLSGRTVATTTTAELDVTSLPVGTYLLKVKSAGTEETVKVVIVR